MTIFQSTVAGLSGQLGLTVPLPVGMGSLAVHEPVQAPVQNMAEMLVTQLMAQAKYLVDSDTVQVYI